MTQDRNRLYSPNPDFAVGVPENEHPDATRARLYDFHARAGSLALFFEMYPRPSADNRTEQERGRERER